MGAVRGDRDGGALAAALVITGAYVRGERTNTELRREAAASPVLAPWLCKCLGVSALAQELLEELGCTPFDPDLDVPGGLAMTRAGMLRNLDLAAGKQLEPAALADWVTDGYSWSDGSAPDDPVLEEIASEIMPGGEDLDAILVDPERLALYRWHLENTPPALAPRASFGFAIAANRAAIERALLARVQADLGDDEFRAAVRGALHDALDALPGLEDELAAAAAELAGRGAGLDALRAFLICVSRSADPAACVVE